MDVHRSFIFNWQNLEGIKMSTSRGWINCRTYRLWNVVVQSLSRVRLFTTTPWTAACHTSLSFTISWSLLKLMSIELVMPFNHLILCHCFLLLPSIFPSIRVFSNESALHIRWPKYWSFGISPSSEYSGLIFFRIDWFDLLAVQGTLKSLLQHHNSKASVLQCSAFFTAQLQFSCSVEFDCLWQPHGLQQSRPPCPPATPGIYSNSCPLSRWCHPTILSSVGPFFCLQSFPASESFPVSQFFASGGQTIRVSASTSVLPMNTQDWFWSPKKTLPLFPLVPQSICHEVMEPDAMILVFWILSSKPTFSLSSFTFIKKLFTISSLSAIRVVSSALLLLSRFSHVQFCATP